MLPEEIKEKNYRLYLKKLEQVGVNVEELDSRYGLQLKNASFTNANDYGNAYSVSEWWLDPNTSGPGAHSHDENVELFYVIAGVASILTGAEWLEAPAGSFIRIPAGVLHDFENRTDQRVGLLNVFLPGGFEENMPAVSKWFAENPPVSR